jgi:hypothetical protein
VARLQRGEQVAVAVQELAKVHGDRSRHKVEEHVAGRARAAEVRFASHEPWSRPEELLPRQRGKCFDQLRGLQVRDCRDLLGETLAAKSIVISSPVCVSGLSRFRL